MTATGEDDQSTVAHLDDHGLIVKDKRIRFPVVVPPCVLHWEAGLITRRALDFARHQDGIVKEETGLALFDDREAGATQRRSTGGWDFTRRAAWNGQPASVPELWVQEHRQACRAHAADESIQSSRVLEV